MASCGGPNRSSEIVAAGYSLNALASEAVAAMVNNQGQPGQPFAFAPSAAQLQLAQQQNNTSTSGINPNYKLPTGDILLKKASDFSAGAGDVLSLGTTYLARKYIFHSDSVVDKGSGAYMAGAVTGAAIGVALGKEMGPQGKIFGTRFGGNQPLLNSGDTLRVGWSYIRSSGQYVFRIGGTAVGLIKENPHINLWPPSWWLK